MADYYPLIARAISGLDPSAPGESRRALYERARAALIAQLRSVQPPLSESEITRERLSLEEAVRKVESEAAQRARDARSGGGASRGGDAFRRANARTPETASTVAAPAGRPRPSSPPPRDQRPPLGQEERGDQRAQRNLRPDAPLPRPQPPPQPQITMQDPQLPPVRDRGGGPPRRGEATPPPLPQAPGVRGFRDITADADDLGRAAAQANRAARKTYANVPSPSPEFDRLEPSMENRGDPDAPYSYQDSLEEADRYSPQDTAMPPQRSRLSQDRDREPKKPRRAGGGFPVKLAIAGVVLVVVGA